MADVKGRRRKGPQGARWEDTALQQGEMHCGGGVEKGKRDGKVSWGFCGHLQRGNSRMEKSKTKTVPKGLAGVSKGLTYPLELVSALGMSYLGLAFCSSRALGVYIQWRGPPPPPALQGLDMGLGP